MCVELNVWLCVCVTLREDRAWIMADPCCAGCYRCGCLSSVLDPRPLTTALSWLPDVPAGWALCLGQLIMPEICWEDTLGHPRQKDKMQSTNRVSQVWLLLNWLSRHTWVISWGCSSIFVTLHRSPVRAQSDNDISSYKKSGWNVWLLNALPGEQPLRTD